MEKPDTSVYASLPTSIVEALECAKGGVVGDQRVWQAVQVVQLASQAILQIRCMRVVTH